MHELRHPLLPQWLPGEQHHPGLEPPGLRGRLAQRARPVAFDEQLPGVHRSYLPRAVRGGMHTQHYRPAGDDQIHRMRDHRPRMAGRMGHAAARRCANRQIRRRDRFGPGRPCLCSATGAGRARGHRFREKRPGRWPPSLRHPRLQDGEDAHQPAGRADGSRGCDLQDKHRGGRGRFADRLAGQFRCHRAGRRGGGSARIGDTGRGTVRRPPRHGIPDAAEQAQCRRRRTARRTARHADRNRQGRYRHWRRRHRLGLRRHLEPAGCKIRHTARNHAETA